MARAWLRSDFNSNSVLYGHGSWNVKLIWLEHGSDLLPHIDVGAGMLGYCTHMARYEKRHRRGAKRNSPWLDTKQQLGNLRWLSCLSIFPSSPSQPLFRSWVTPGPVKLILERHINPLSCSSFYQLCQLPLDSCSSGDNNSFGSRLCHYFCLGYCSFMLTFLSFALGVCRGSCSRLANDRWHVWLCAGHPALTSNAYHLYDLTYICLCWRCLFCTAPEDLL